MKSSVARAIVVLTAATSSFCNTYSLKDNIVGSQFFDAFTFENIRDPTSGRVKYVDKATAQSQRLAYTSGDNFILRADSTTILSPGGPGRNSFRIKSTNTHTTTVLVFDIHHMPQGCGTWPAIWTTDEGIWPNGGEIDILEGVNDRSSNAATLHTSAGCTMPAARNQLGISTQLDCNSQTNDNAGCGVNLKGQSYGPQFNGNGGGWYAMERTNTAIRIWFWPRNGAVPSDVKNGASMIDTVNWGTPDADFPNTNCDIAQHFNAHHIIIDLTFCGTWAGSVYGLSGCPGTCVDYVDNNPSAFSNAYFEFGSLKVYQ